MLRRRPPSEPIVGKCLPLPILVDKYINNNERMPSLQGQKCAQSYNKADLLHTLPFSRDQRKAQSSTSIIDKKASTIPTFPNFKHGRPLRSWYEPRSAAYPLRHVQHSHVSSPSRTSVPPPSSPSNLPYLERERENVLSVSNERGFPLSHPLQPSVLILQQLARTHGAGWVCEREHVQRQAELPVWRRFHSAAAPGPEP
jgi:hypothetical protein